MTPGGGLLSKRDGDARQKNRIKAPNEPNLGVAQVLFDPNCIGKNIGFPS